MKRASQPKMTREVVSLALTWDGARWPLRNLPAAARIFLGAGRKVPRAAEMARLFSEDRVRELRVCWVPRLKGGEDVLCAPFETADGLRMRFRVAKMKRLGDALGVVYRRERGMRQTGARSAPATY